jgi:hypothetical protein
LSRRELSRRKHRKRTRMTQPNTVLVGGESHANRNGAGFSFARAQKCEQMTAHEYQPRTATPAGDVQGGAIPICSGERRQTKPMHACSKTPKVAKKQPHAGKSGGLGEQVRAAARPHLVDLVSRGVERSIKRRVERVERRSVHERGGEKVGDVAEGKGE